MSSTDETPVKPSEEGRIEWLSDLVRLEIVLWDRVDRRLKKDGLSLAFFEVLRSLAQSSTGSMRVGDVATRMGITVGGASKLVERVQQAGYLERRVDEGDGRATVLVLTASGKRKLDKAVRSYDAEVSDALDGLSTEEQTTFHSMVRRILAAQPKR